FVMRGGTDAETAQEVAQETLIMVWRKAASFDRSRASAATWIYAIARNKRIDLARRTGRPVLSTEDWLAVFAPEEADADQPVRALKSSCSTTPRVRWPTGPRSPWRFMSRSIRWRGAWSSAWARWAAR